MLRVPVPVVEPWAVGWLTCPAAPYEVLRAGPGLVGSERPYSCRAHDLSASHQGALGEVPWDHKMCLPRWLRELSFPQKGEKCAFPSPFLDSFLWVFCREEDSAGHAEETPYRTGRVLGWASQTAMTGLAGQG